MTDYTYLQLSTAYGIFWGIMLLQIVVVTVFQVFYHFHFSSFSFSGVFHQILHAVEHVHMFDTSNDWDEEGENSREKQQKITGIEVKTSDNETKKFPGQENIQVKEVENSLITKEGRDSPENEEGKSFIEGAENT